MGLWNWKLPDYHWHSETQKILIKGTDKFSQKLLKQNIRNIKNVEKDSWVSVTLHCSKSANYQTTPSIVKLKKTIYQKKNLNLNSVLTKIA